MGRTTKQAIIDSFIALINQKPLYMITVQSIVKSCGINRNTFYYHFKDVFSVLDAIFEVEEQRRHEAAGDLDELAALFYRRVEFANRNKRAIANLYNNNIINRDRCQKYIYSGIDSIVNAYVRRQAEGLPAGEEIIAQNARLCRYAVAGLITEWMADGMRGDLEYFVKNIVVFANERLRGMMEEQSRGGAAQG